MEQLSPETINPLVNVGLVVLGLFLATYFLANKREYDYLMDQNVFYSALFLITYIGIISLGLLKGSNRPTLFALILCMGMSVEAGLNTRFMVQGVKADWNYPLRSVYSESYDDIQQLVDAAKAKQSSFYRMANLDSKSSNESFNFGYSGIDQFSSIRNRRALSYLNQAGFRSEGTNLTVNYGNNTLLMDSLFGLTYNLSKEDPQKFGFTQVNQQGAYGLYENAYALPLGIWTDEGIYEEKHVNNQTALFNYLSGDTHEYVQFTQPVVQKTDNVQIEEEGAFTYYSAEQPDKDMTIEWTVSTPAQVQPYLSLYAEDNSMMAEATAEVTVGGVSRTYQMKKVNQYYNLGYMPEAGTTTVKVTFKGTSVIRLLTPDVMLLRTDAFQHSAQAIQQKGVDLKVEKTRVSAEVTLEQEQVLFTTIPYDKGWEANIDGQRVETKPVQGGLMSLSVPKGTHTLVLSYRPQGFRLGVGLFVGCLIVFVSYLVYVRKRKGTRT